MNGLASMLRPAVMAAPGHTFVCGDWSGIEARVLPWLANSKGARSLLSQYVEIDADPDLPDMYVRQAELMYPGRGADERQIGKVAVLSLGYQGGGRAFQAMARNYGLDVSVAQGDEIKENWRRANRWAVSYWEASEEAMWNAIRAPGAPFEAGRVHYVMSTDWDCLWAVLPSGKTLAYPRPREQMVMKPWGEEGLAITALKANWTPGEGDTEWPRVALYGGLLCENATQACAAEVLVEALRRCDAADAPVVGHTHDEILLEVSDDEVSHYMSWLEAEMLTMPSWSSGLPLAVSLWSGPRYRK